MLEGVAHQPELGRNLEVCSSVRRFAAEDPKRLFCRVLSGDSSEEVTYGELLNAAERYAAVYLDYGAGAGSVVLIMLRHGSDLFASFLGAMLIGALPSFLPFLTPKQNPELYWKAHYALFSRVHPSVLVTWGENLASMRNSMPDLCVPVHLAENTPRTGEVLNLPDRDFRGPAFIQHSSGTTGLKKGIVITHEALAAQVVGYASALGLSSAETIATWLPLYHDMGLIACFLMPVMLGIPVMAMDPFEWVLKPALLLDAVERHRCTLAWLPNFAFHHIRSLASETRRWDLSSVKAFINCSEPCKPETFQAFAERFGVMGLGLDKLQTCYALAENVFCATQSRLGEPVRVLRADRRAFYATGRVERSDEPDSLDFLECGHPIAGVNVRVLDAEGRGVPDGHVGEIALSGVCLFGGYQGNSCEPRERLSGGWYRTRDLGFLFDGALYVTGRQDDLLVVHGSNYYAHDIEYAVNQVPGVMPGRCVAVGEYRPEAGTSEVIVLAEVDDRTRPRISELKREIRNKIFSEMALQVREVDIVPARWLIKTTSGKISRVENLKRFRSEIQPTSQTS